MCFSNKKPRLIGVALGLVLAFGPLAIALADYDWPQFDGRGSYAGWNTQETILTQGNVSGLVQKYQITLPDVADGAPAYLSAVQTSNGTHNMLFLTTKAGYILSLDAQTGATLWSHQNGPGSCKINNGNSTCYTTSSPAVDPNRQFVYSYGLDGKAHKYQVSDGTEILTGGWPEVTTLKAFDEKGSSALNIATAKSGTSYLYVANGGYPGDNGDYQGHITTINLSTGVQNVFNAVCSDQTVHFAEKPATPDCPSVQTAIWARVGIMYDPNNDKIYMATGNGDFAAASNYWGDTVFDLNPDGTGANGKPLDTYTPTNYQLLQNHDTDIGSTAPVLIPTTANTPSIYSNIAVQSGKDGQLRLINLSNLSQHNGGPQPGNTGGEILITPVPQGNEVLTAPTVWINPADNSPWVFVANDNGISGLKLTFNGTNTPSLTKQWQNGQGGTSPLIANNVLFYAGSDNKLHALNPATGTQLWSGAIGGIHWASPMMANGWVYMADQSKHLTAFALNQPPPTNTPVPTSTPITPPPVGDTIGVYRSSTFYLRLSNNSGYAQITAAFNPASQPYPVVGEWPGTGIDTIGVYDQANGLFSLRNSNASGTPDSQFVLGNPGDVPFAGKWQSGAAHDGVGVFRPGNGLIFLKTALTTGYADNTMVLGIPGDVGLAGDWNGKGYDSPGVYRPSDQAFYLSNQVTNGPVYGDYRAQLGNPGDTPFVGDWIAQGHSGIGVFRPSNGLIFEKNALTTGFADNSFVYGIPGDIPLAGHWAVGPEPNLGGILVPGTAAPGPIIGTPTPGNIRD